GPDLHAGRRRRERLGWLPALLRGGGYAGGRFVALGEPVVGRAVGGLDLPGLRAGEGGHGLLAGGGPGRAVVWVHGIPVVVAAVGSACAPVRGIAGGVAYVRSGSLDGEPGVGGGAGGLPGVLVGLLALDGEPSMAGGVVRERRATPLLTGWLSAEARRGRRRCAARFP